MTILLIWERLIWESVSTTRHTHINKHDTSGCRPTTAIRCADMYHCQGQEFALDAVWLWVRVHEKFIAIVAFTFKSNFTYTYVWQNFYSVDF